MEELKQGYVWFNGIVLNNYQTDTYNELSRQIKATYNDDTRERLLDERHRHLVSCFVINSEDERTKVNTAVSVVDFAWKKIAGKSGIVTEVSQDGYVVRFPFSFSRSGQNKVFVNKLQVRLIK